MEAFSSLTKHDKETERKSAALQSFRGLLQLAARPSIGPSPSYGKAHMVLAFLTIGESGLIGRQALAAKAGLKEGPARTIIKKLRDGGYAGANASGCYLTKSGMSALQSFAAKLSPLVAVERSAITMGFIQVGLAVKEGGRAVRGGLEQRDAAIGVGAAGATTLVIKGGRFTIPGGSADCESDFPGPSWGSLRAHLKLANGDAVVLSGAADEVTAKLGALSAALTLL